jgi:hypothetical protein
MASTKTTGQENHCLRCGRKLTKSTGFGPTCARKIRAAAVEAAKADFTEAQAEKAAELIADGGITLQAPGLYVAVSSKGDTTYATDGHSCTCPAGAKDRRCYHELAAVILTIASRPAAALALAA